VLVGIANASNRIVVNSYWEVLQCSGQLASDMALVELSQYEARCRSVLTSFDKEHENLIKNNPDATKEINLVRTGLVEIGQLIQISPQKNGNGVTWKRLIDQAENEKNVLCKHLDGKALFTGMLRLYATTHRELTESLLPECAQEKKRGRPRSRRRKRNSDSDDGSISKRKATDKPRQLPAYQKPRPVATKNYFAPLRAVPMEDAEVNRLLGVFSLRSTWFCDRNNAVDSDCLEFLSEIIVAL
jgi:hypothetical protein